MRKVLLFSLGFLFALCTYAQTDSTQSGKDSTYKKYDSIAIYKVPAPRMTKIGDEPSASAPIGFGNHDTIIKTPDVEAVFPGGSGKFAEFIANNFVYPERCRDEGISGYIVLRFIVDTKGMISNIQVKEDSPSCPEFAKEAIRVLKLSPRWIPAQFNGRFIKAWRQIPVKIALD